MCHSWNLDDFVEEYQQYLRRLRGLRGKTVRNYARPARGFVAATLGEGRVDVTMLTPAEVVEFVTTMLLRWSPSSMKSVRTALRSLLRWLRTEGVCGERFEAAIPRVAHWRLSTLPRRLSDDQLIADDEYTGRGQAIRKPRQVGHE